MTDTPQAPEGWQADDRALVAHIAIQADKRIADYVGEYITAVRAEMRAALIQYGLHIWDCPKNDVPEATECTCGFDATLATLRAAPSPPPEMRGEGVTRVTLMRAMCHAKPSQCHCANRGGIVDDYEACRIVSRHANDILALAPAFIQGEGMSG